MKTLKLFTRKLTETLNGKIVRTYIYTYLVRSWQASTARGCIIAARALRPRGRAPL